MQYCVPRKKSLKKRVNWLKIFIVGGVSIVVFCVLFLGFYLSSKHNKIFKEKTFYYACASKTKKIKELENMQDDVKTLGGAGKIYQKDKYYYMILNVYLDEESATQVVENNKQIYPNGVVLEIKTDKISNSSRRSVRNNDGILKFLKKLILDVETVAELTLKYLSNDISENSFCSSVLLLKFDIDDLDIEIDMIKEGELKEITKTHINLEMMYFSNFLNNILDSDKKSSVACDFAVGLSLVCVDFFNNL